MEDQLQIHEEGRGAQTTAAQGDTMSEHLSVFSWADVTKDAKTDVTKNPKTDVTKNPKTDVTKNPKTDVTKDPKTDVTKDPKTDMSRLLTLLSLASNFQCASLCYISHKDDWKTLADRSSVIILYHSHSPETPLPDLSDMKEFVDHCRGKHGPGNIKVAIGDVEDLHLERQVTEWWMVGDCRDCELLTLSKAEMKLLIEHKINPLSVERRMANKLRHIYQILHEAAEKNFKWKYMKVVGTRVSFFKYSVGILSRLTNSDYSWITELLHSDHFRDYALDVRHLDMSDDPTNSEKCSFGILYFKKRRQINEMDAEDIKLIQHYRSRLGKDNVIIVMDDVEDSSDQQKIRILESHPDIKDLYHNLFLFKDQEKSSEYKTLLPSLININKTAQPQGAQRTNWWPAVQQHLQLKKIGLSSPVLGIFSRSSTVEYSWLEAMLKPRFTEVKCFYIANNGFRQFMDVVSQCKFGILYHTKNRGRINVTDVADSLYDEELEYMSKKLGKLRVCVVIDDMDDNSEEVKNRILHGQPKIQNLAKDLYLIKHGPPKQKVRDLEQSKPIFSS